MKLPSVKSVFSFTIFGIVPYVLLYVYVIGPLFSMGGDTTKTAAEQASILHRAKLYSDGMRIVALAVFIIVVVVIINDIAHRLRKNKVNNGPPK